MALDVVALTARAMQTAKRLGLLGRATITRPAPPPHPVTGVQSGSAVSFDIDYDTPKLETLARRNQSFTAATVAVYVAAAACTFPPAPGMTIQVGGTTYRVIAIQVDAVGGVPVGYFIGGAV